MGWLIDPVKGAVQRMTSREIASKAVGEHCKGVTKRYTPTAGGQQEVSTIPERDVYCLLMRSKMPSAERFEEWVVGEVLPSVRKTGSYSVTAAPPDFTDPVAAARAWADAKESALKAIAVAQEQAAQIEAQKPAVEFVERYVAAEGNKGVRQVAQLLNAPNEREFTQWLVDESIMYRLEGRLMPMANQRHTGRFVVMAGVARETEHAYNQTKFTPKGL